MPQLLASILDQVDLTTLLDIGITALLIYWLFSLIRGTRAVSLVIGVTRPLRGLRRGPRASTSGSSPRSSRPAPSSASSPSSSSSSRSSAARLERIGRVGSFAWLFSPAEQRAADHVADEVARAAAAAVGRRPRRADRPRARDRPRGDRRDRRHDPRRPLAPTCSRTIFAPRTPLHDGAVIIRDETILAAGALLPLAEMTVHTERFGTRHRAALGITEQTDARRGRRLRGERPGQPRRAGPDRPQPQRAAAGAGDPVAARARSTAGAARAPAPAARPIGGRAPRLVRPRRGSSDAAGARAARAVPDDDGSRAPARAPR